MDHRRDGLPRHKIAYRQGRQVRSFHLEMRQDLREVLQEEIAAAHGFTLL
jgi:hypothetical protein